MGGAELRWAGQHLTFVLAHFLDPRQRVDLHQRVRDADHVHHVHHTLQKMNDKDATLSTNTVYNHCS